MATALPSHYSHYAFASLRRRPYQPPLPSVTTAPRPRYASAVSVFAALVPCSPMFSRLRMPPASASASGSVAQPKRPRPLSVVDALVAARAPRSPRPTQAAPGTPGSWSSVSLTHSAGIASPPTSAVLSSSAAQPPSPLPHIPVIPPSPVRVTHRDSAFVGFFKAFAEDRSPRSISSPLPQPQPARPTRSPARQTASPATSTPYLRPLLLARSARPARRRTRPRLETPDSPTLVTEAARGGLVPIGSARHHRKRADASWLTQAQNVLADIHIAEAEEAVVLSATPRSIRHGAAFSS